MIYTKTTENGIQKETPLISLQMFCKCPGCSTEVKMRPEWVEELAQEMGENFSFADVSTYCDKCQEELNMAREIMQDWDLRAIADRMPLDKLKEAYALLCPYTYEA